MLIIIFSCARAPAAPAPGAEPQNAGVIRHTSGFGGGSEQGAVGRPSLTVTPPFPPSPVCSAAAAPAGGVGSAGPAASAGCDACPCPGLIFCLSSRP